MTINLEKDILEQSALKLKEIEHESVAFRQLFGACLRIELTQKDKQFDNIYSKIQVLYKEKNSFFKKNLLQTLWESLVLNSSLDAQELYSIFIDLSDLKISQISSNKEGLHIVNQFLLDALIRKKPELLAQLMLFNENQSIRVNQFLKPEFFTNKSLKKVLHKKENAKLIKEHFLFLASNISGDIVEQMSNERKAGHWVKNICSFTDEIAKSLIESVQNNENYESSNLGHLEGLMRELNVFAIQNPTGLGSQDIADIEKKRAQMKQNFKNAVAINLYNRLALNFLYYNKNEAHDRAYLKCIEYLVEFTNKDPLVIDLVAKRNHISYLASLNQVTSKKYEMSEKRMASLVILKDFILLNAGLGEGECTSFQPTDKIFKL